MAAKPVEVVRTVGELRKIVRQWRSEGLKVALVPTMGALHEGHLSLAREGLARADRCVASIFVNPAQFSPEEDFSTYPRTFEDDLAKFANVGGHLIWAPTAGEMYPEGFATRVAPEGAALGLETDFRPHFFGGVATVCCKLFTQVLPDYAMFGEKDYQQLAVVTQMVRDLDLPLEIIGCETIREADGLAMSSRNAYLSADERAKATLIYQTINQVGESVAKGDAIDTAAKAGEQALRDGGFDPVDYVAVRDAGTLAPVTSLDGRPLRVLAAAWLGSTRLIDNVAVPMPRS